MNINLALLLVGPLPSDWALGKATFALAKTLSSVDKGTSAEIYLVFLYKISDMF